MKRLPQIFLVFFLADGLLSLATIGIPNLSILQRILAFLVLLFAALLHLIMMLTPRLPKRILLPSTVFTLWCGLTNAFPSGLVFGSQAQLVLSLAQTLLGIGLLLVLKKQPFFGRIMDRPAFSWPNFSLVSLGNVSMILVFISLLILSGLSFVENQTAGYLRIRPNGISLEERWFQRNDGKMVRLIGMVHIAKDQFYSDLRSTLPEKESAIVLLEGVTDRTELLQAKLNYVNLADSLGLASQSDSDFMKNASVKSYDAEGHSVKTQKEELSRSGIEYWRADVDTSDFQTSTLDCIEAVGSIFASKSLEEALRKLTDPHSPLNQEADNETFWSDIVDLRNDHLIEQMQKALLRSNTVIVPWGAMHMPVLEKQLKDWGFQETYRIRRVAFSFQKQPLAKLK